MHLQDVVKEVRNWIVHLDEGIHVRKLQTGIRAAPKPHLPQPDPTVPIALGWPPGDTRKLMPPMGALLHLVVMQKQRLVLFNDAIER